jgi:hypothetical protein
MDNCTCQPWPAYDGPSVSCPAHGLDAETIRWLHANGLCLIQTPDEAEAWLSWKEYKTTIHRINANQKEVNDA